MVNKEEIKQIKNYGRPSLLPEVRQPPAPSQLSGVDGENISRNEEINRKSEEIHGEFFDRHLDESQEQGISGTVS